LILVPVFDEAPLIERKLDNLEALTWPAAHRRVVIVDGGSTDGTLALAARWIGARDGYALLQTIHRNKTAQIRDALASDDGAAWVLVTDADAMLPPDTIERMMDAAKASEGIAVVGVRVCASFPFA
jgi:succinoglycan biosynthesis protein ExoA